MGGEPIIQVVDDDAMLARVSADWVVRAVQDGIAVRGQATVALSGGSTPQGMFARLAGPPHTTRLDFSAIHFYFVDERCVPPDDPLSNYGQAHRLLLSRVPVAAGNVHRIRGELDASAAADDYDRRLHEQFAGPWPQFDMVVLGIGSDGHTGSLFPGSPAVDEQTRWAVAAQGGQPVRHRVTLTLPVINSARLAMFLVDKPDKAEVVARALAGDQSLPAALVRPLAGQVRWLLTPGAAAAIARR